MLSWNNGVHQVQWDEPGVKQKDFADYLVKFAQGNFGWRREDLQEGIFRRFGIRVEVQRNEPLFRGGPDHFEVVTVEGRPLPPVR